MNKFLSGIKKLLLKIKQVDYRHYICGAFMVASILLAIFRFPLSFPRIGEGFVDIWNSGKFYVAELFSVEVFGRVTVMDFSNVSLELPFGIPQTWDEFVMAWKSFWNLFFSEDNFSAYLDKFANVLFYLSHALMIVVPIIAVVFIVKYLRKDKQNNLRDVESKALIRWKRFEDKVCLPAKNWVLDFIDFLLVHKKTWVYWFCFVWLYNFNFFGIFLEFIAFIIYFLASFQFIDIYTQLVKLFYDLSIVIDFFPTLIWIAIFFIILHFINKKIAFNRLYKNERKNRCFINDLAVCTILDGEMGTGKTQMNMDMSLSFEVEFRERALDIILDINSIYPNFPWPRYEDDLKKAIEEHEIFTLLSCKKWLGKRFNLFKKNPCRENIWGYDIERHPSSFYDNLKEESIWQALLDYAKAYLIYTIECSLIVANYSIRTDGIRDDIGNFPIWDYDFFKRDKMLVESYSQRCHILDFDMLRLGKQMLEKNPNRNAIGYGIYVVTELDKELKNAPELKEVKSNSEECNQKNDLTHKTIKMIRHVATIRNQNFVFFTGEMQRCESLGIDVRGLGDVIHIEEKASRKLTLPIFSPFYLFSFIFSRAYGKYSQRLIKNKFSRGDKTLGMYLLDNIMSLFYHYDLRVRNLYGYRVMWLMVERGRKEGEGLSKKYYIQDKKTYSARYTTDCQSGIFDGRAKDNKVGLIDLPCYSGLMATPKELDMQHSHYQEEHKKLRK